MLKMCQQIREKGGHIAFRIDLKVTTLGQNFISNSCGKFGVDSFSHSWVDVENVSAN